MAVARETIINLYRNMIRESKKWDSYNFSQCLPGDLRNVEERMCDFLFDNHVYPAKSFDDTNLITDISTRGNSDERNDIVVNYALRKIRHEFRENKSLKDSEKIKESYKFGVENLDMIRRQVALGHLYSTRRLVIETSPTHATN